MRVKIRDEILTRKVYRRVLFATTSALTTSFKLKPAVFTKTETDSVSGQQYLAPTLQTKHKFEALSTINFCIMIIHMLLSKYVVIVFQDE